jgi:hypothetical protein
LPVRLVAADLPRSAADPPQRRRSAAAEVIPPGYRLNIATRRERWRLVSGRIWSIAGAPEAAPSPEGSPATSGRRDLLPRCPPRSDPPAHALDLSHLRGVGLRGYTRPGCPTPASAAGGRTVIEDAWLSGIAPVIRYAVPVRSLCLVGKCHRRSARGNDLGGIGPNGPLGPVIAFPLALRRMLRDELVAQRYE